MKLPRSNGQKRGGRSAQIVFLVTVALVMTNLSALVDRVLHPDIPYFDTEHLVVGGITGLVSVLSFGLVLLYLRHLQGAVRTINTLEELLPICACCKKVLRAHEDPALLGSWQPIESFLTERTASRFSHGICPECMAKLYPEYPPQDAGAPRGPHRVA
ncbi:MAG: hypothetical protein M5U22_15905 [Thermoleophilia bacterium]|nr:hypothetical protein [Thermoleophilia bacterium]